MAAYNYLYSFEYMRYFFFFCQVWSSQVDVFMGMIYFRSPKALGWIHSIIWLYELQGDKFAFGKYFPKASVYFNQSPQNGGNKKNKVLNLNVS